MSGLFEHLEAFDEGNRVATRQALAVANKRFNDRFAGFLRQASSESEFKSRLALIEADVTNMAHDVANEYGGEANKIESAVMASAYAIRTAGCGCDGNCGDDCKCAGENCSCKKVAKKEEDKAEWEKAQDEEQMSAEHSQLPPWLKKQDKKDKKDKDQDERTSSVNKLSYGQRRFAELDSQPVANPVPLEETPGYKAGGDDINETLDKAPSAVGTGVTSARGPAVVPDWVRKLEELYPQIKEMREPERAKWFGGTPTEDLLNGIDPSEFRTYHNDPYDADSSDHESKTAGAHKVKKEDDKFYVVEDGDEKAAGPFDSQEEAYARANELNDKENLEKKASDGTDIASLMQATGIDPSQMGSLGQMAQGASGLLGGETPSIGDMMGGGLGGSIADSAQDGLNAVTDVGNAVGDLAHLDLGGALSEGVGALGDAADVVLDPIGGALNSIFGSNNPTIAGFFSDIGEGIGDAAGFAKGLGEDAAGAVGDAANAVGGAANAVGDAANAGVNAVGDAANAAGGAIGDAANAIANPIGDAANAVGGALGDAAGTAGQAVGDVAGFGQALGEDVGNAAGQAAGAVGDAANAVGALPGQAADAVGNAAGQAWDDASAGFGKGMQQGQAAEGAIGPAIGQGVDAAGNAIGQAGSDFGSGVERGVPQGQQAYQNITSATTETGDSTEESEKLPKGDEDAHDGPSPKMDKKKWVPNATNPDGNLKPIKTEGENSPHPTRQMDVKQHLDYAKNDDPWEHDNNVWKREDLPTAKGDEAGFEGTRNIEQHPTKTFPNKNQTDPVTREALAKLAALWDAGMPSRQVLDALAEQYPTITELIQKAEAGDRSAIGTLVDSNILQLAGELGMSLYEFDPANFPQPELSPEVLEGLERGDENAIHEYIRIHNEHKQTLRDQKAAEEAAEEAKWAEEDAANVSEPAEEIEEIIEEGDKPNDRVEVIHEEDETPAGIDDIEGPSEDELESLLREIQENPDEYYD